MRRSKLRLYSITSTARASNVGGTISPSAFAVLRLITSSYLVGADAGSSRGPTAEVRPPVLPEDQPLIGKMISNLAPLLTPDIAVIRPS
jgi:hypothetical protein